MPHIEPLTLENTQGAAGDIAWIPSATGYSANSLPTLSHRPQTAGAVPGLIPAVIAIFGFNDRRNALMETETEPQVREFSNINNCRGGKEMRD